MRYSSPRSTFAIWLILRQNISLLSKVLCPECDECNRISVEVENREYGSGVRHGTRSVRQN